LYDILITGARVLTLDAPGEITAGHIGIKDGYIAEVGEGDPITCRARVLIEAGGMVAMPSLVDCHTHLMEYAALEVHHVRGEAQAMAGVANLLAALQCGITALGEHHLGHPELVQPTERYKEIISGLPLDVPLSCGCCCLGLDPPVFVSSTRPGRVVAAQTDLSDEEYGAMAEASDFPGENIFLTATVANLPLEAAPRAGEITCTPDELARIVGIFHSKGKKIGAHLEGDEAARMFIKAGGDVIHHGHGIGLDTARLMAQKGVALVVTPHAGTSRKPTTPHEVYEFYKQGVTMALASDSYIPVHSESDWVNLPANSMAGPRDFLRVCRPVLQYLLDRGVPASEALKLITVNGRLLLGRQGHDGALKPGSKADLIVCDGIPALETVSAESIKYVIKDGKVLVARK